MLNEKDRLASPFGVLLAALLVAALLAMACGSPPQDLADELASTVPRPIEPRLSADFDYRRCETPVGGQVPGMLCAAPEDPGRLQALSHRLARARQEHPRSPEVQRVRGLYHLIWSHQEGELDKAVQVLVEAAERSGAASAHSDLSAAYMLRGQVQDRPLDLFVALAEAEIATLKEPGLASAWFNRGLAAQNLFLLDEARRSWKEFLKLEEDTGWSEEARQHLERLPPMGEEFWDRHRNALRNAEPASLKELIGKQRQAARELGERELLGEWAQYKTSGQHAKARQALNQARRIGASLATNGDTLLMNAVAVIDNSDTLQQSDTLQRQELIQGHLAFAAGHRLHEPYQIDAAVNAFERARPFLARAQSPFVAWTDFELATLLFRKARYLEALALLDKAETVAPPGEWPVLRGRIAWIRGLCLLAAGSTTASLTAYGQAIDYFHSTREDSNAAYVLMLRAQVYNFIHRKDEAWMNLYKALAGTPRMLRRKRLHGVYDLVAEHLLQAGYPESALFFQDAVVQLHRQPGSPPTDITHAYLKRSRTYADIARFDQAEADLAEAQKHLAEIDDAGMSRQLATDILVSRAGLLAQRNPAAAVDDLTTALAERRDTNFFLPPLYRARARALIRGGHHEAALLDLLEVVRILEEGLTGITNASDRVSYLRERSGLLGEILEVADRTEIQQAQPFEIAERLNGRVLTDLARNDLTRNERRLPSAQEIADRLPKDVAVIEYALLPARSVAWVVRHGHPVQKISLSVGQVEIGQLVEQWRSGLKYGIRNRETREKATAAELYRTLFKPLEGFLEGSSSLLFVPTEDLRRVPFAAFYDPDNAEYLVERWRIGVAPSASFFVSVADQRREKNHSALVIGDPAFNETLLQDWPRLQHARREAQEVAAFYNVDPLLDAEATVERFMDLAAQHYVVHFAGHAVSNTLQPELSFLALAPGPRNKTGQLLARDVIARDFSKTWLVVLSACSTAGGDDVPLDAGLPLAQAFLAAGVPAVVASLWQVDDTPTAQLMSAFHQALAEGAAPWQALRQAQLKLLRAEDANLRSPRAWAAFQVYGSGNS